MPLPSLWNTGEQSRAWSPTRAAGCGAIIGALAAVFKLHSPFHEMAVLTPGPVTHVSEIVGAMLAFALLCAGAAALRNFVVRQLIGSELR